MCRFKFLLVSCPSCHAACKQKSIFASNSFSLTWSCRTAPVPAFAPLLQLKASLQGAFHQGLQPFLKTAQQGNLVFTTLYYIQTLDVFMYFEALEFGRLCSIISKKRCVYVLRNLFVNQLTLSSSSCCLLFSSTAALRSSSFCLCSSNRLQRSSTVRSYCSRALRSFSLISCSLAAERSKTIFCCMFLIIN